MMSIIEIIKEIRNNSSTNKKIEIISTNKSNIILKDLLICTYNNDTYGIKKIKLPGNYGTKTVEENFQKFKRMLEAFKLRLITGNAAIKAVEDFLSTCSKESAEIFVAVLEKDLKLGANDTLINRAFGDETTIEKAKFQLAKKYLEVIEKTPQKLPKTFYITPKLDGFRCLFIKDNDAFVSREGKGFVGFSFIEEECRKILNELGVDFLDGELLYRNQDFKSVSKIVTKSKNISIKEKMKIKFNIFALGFINKSLETEKMYELMEKIRAIPNLKYVNVVEHEIIENNKDLIIKRTEDYIKEGYEGSMLRHPLISYSWKRDNNLLKVKLFKEHDFFVEELLPGANKGKYSNTLGSMIIVGDYEGKNIYSGVGLKNLTDEDRDEIWNNKSMYIGQACEVKFQEIEKDPNENGSYALKFGSFLKWKMRP